MADPIDFYFDFASPYGYFASRRIEELAAAHGRTVIWRPILLGAIFKVTGMKPNLQQPLRGEYLVHDVGRIARLTNAPFTYPDSAPANSVAASRAFYWLTDEHPEQAKLLARTLYHAHWGEGRDIGPAETVVEIAGTLGHDRAAVAAALQDQTVKDRLRAENDAAVDRGVFGSPFVIVDDEPFWGWDRLDMVDRWLSTGGW
ncbi:2-hydroxychromene-2-carboxylate isomerase [Azospirillum sp. YIM DDC1]|uniref:2-hydroxychromene-2-carboxylate isomerase n=1 Tax=Azospirillum aestuarii TaxID=2802052 RepID=A0ABS1I508_9PROT|nr:2-hydroxychromene-2-carboxylate isomerase [Azospirillum aestuarii]MBK3778027.1 2-hydroxychromene-2-carboxylate isomerase [Azospirillum brasilense]MBK4722131.1 2-hydroxychromene-2-carboxylate isomerase [Azospirillum aestuarii]TWA84620.1 2-hydroxychromene-2-carboxylate isomerase [Azospirillum brasilense]